MKSKADNQNKHCRKQDPVGMRSSDTRKKRLLIGFLVVCAVAFFLSSAPETIYRQIKGVGEQIGKHLVYSVDPTPAVDYWVVIDRIPTR